MISSPAACSERIAVSRPEPGPLTKTSTFCRPCSIPLRAALSAVTWAANGVDLREPFNPAEPAPLLRLLPASDGLLRALASPGVRLRALAVDRQVPAMAETAVAADLREALDRLGALATEVALELEVRVDAGPELRDLVVGQVLDL